jgi:ankyrin repeat protein
MEEQMPMHDAAIVGDVVNIRRLVAEGADVNGQDDEGGSPLHEAAYHGHVGAVRVLVEVGADLEASYPDGPRMRPLHEAACNGHVAEVKALVELGADIGALTNSGETPLQLSIRCGHHHVARVLRAAEKKPTQQAIDHAERMGALLIEEEEREQAAQRKVRGCSTLTLAELHCTRLGGVSIAQG